MIRLKQAIFFFLFVVTSPYSPAQNQNPCAPETSQFDFWVGKWNVEWTNQDGTTGEGTNQINSILKGCVVEENFDATDALNFAGKSFSVYNPNKNIWQQTWVDDQGGYMVFNGGMSEDKMILSRKITRQEKELIQRMVFYNISENELDWNWESSDDNGETWKLNWKIHYTRIQ
jgi:hypothetical protein